MKVQHIELQFNSTLEQNLALAWLRANNIKCDSPHDKWVGAEEITMAQLNRLNTIFENLKA